MTPRAPKMLAEAPFSASPDLHAGIQTRLDEVVAIARESLGDALRSVVLGGSLACGRAFGVDDAGELRLLSDLDLYFVAEPQDGVARLRKRLGEWVASDPFFASPADVAVVDSSYFGQSRTSMPTHQLAHANRLLWGAPVEISGARDAGGRSRVDATDAAQLLLNRCVEALDRRLEDPRSLPALVHRTKQFIDAPMAWLAATGRYSPDRREQIRVLDGLAKAWDGPGRQRFEGAVEHWTACLDARDAGVVGRERLEALARPENDLLPGGAAWSAWTGGFAVALLGDGGLETLRASLGSSLDRELLAGASRRWLRREPVLQRLRRARRWCSVAPPGISPWWRHGTGGCGPDRIFAAAALRVHGAREWGEPLAGLVPGRTLTPGELHALWWRWIQGRDDDA